MAEPITTYKLMILALLDKSEVALTNTQLADFFLEKDYTNYFTVQEALCELSDAGFTKTESTHSNTQYELTPAGKESLSYFSDKLSAGILTDITEFLTEHKIQIRSEASVYADYYKTTGGSYAARCQLKEKGESRIDLTITVPKREFAEVICENWKNQNEEVFEYLMTLLLK